jgi:anti-sigma regulatory factor (Ser/Thr protein kinase)
MKREPVEEIRISADLEAAEKVRIFVKDVLDRYVLSEEERFKAELSLHEICINIVLHAYPGKKGDLNVRTWPCGDRVYFEFADTGVAFDPCQAAPPDLKAKLKSGRRGGYGIFLYRTLLDGFEYRREAGKNILTVFKTVPVSGTSRSV